MNFFTLLLLSLSQMSFANTNSVDMSAFSGRFELDLASSTANCKLNVHGPIQFVDSHIEGTVKFIYEGTRSYQQMQNINMGKIKFNSCFSDGLLGFTETILQNNKIDETTTFLKPGIFCTGGGVDHLRNYSWEIRGEQFIESIGGKTYCTFNKLK